jgi:hypothetical protein
MSLRSLAAIFGGLLVALFISSTMGPLFALVVGGLAMLVILAITHRDGSSPFPEQRVGVAWIIHPDGIIVRSGTSTRHIPRATIKRIDRRESLFGSVSQLMIVLHRWSDGPVIASTRILYVEGADEDRVARWQRACEILGLTRSVAAEPAPASRK